MTCPAVAGALEAAARLAADNWPSARSRNPPLEGGGTPTWDLAAQQEQQKHHEQQYKRCAIHAPPLGEAAHSSRRLKSVQPLIGLPSRSSGREEIPHETLLDCNPQLRLAKRQPDKSSWRRSARSYSWPADLPKRRACKSRIRRHVESEFEHRPVKPVAPDADYLEAGDVTPQGGRCTQKPLPEDDCGTCCRASDTAAPIPP